jgi:hypothetical protein
MIVSRKTMDNHICLMEKLLTNIIVIGKNDGKSYFLMEKVWKITIVNRTTMENLNF